MGVALKILVVLYNKKIAASETLQSLRMLCGSQDQADVIIWDNSAGGQEKASIDEYERGILPFKLRYVNTPENLSLSRIYNLVIGRFVTPDDYLMLLDDDTCVTSFFFDELRCKITELRGTVDVFLPRIYNKGVLVSPAKMYFFFGRYFKKLEAGFHSSKYIVAINSGMVISGTFLKKGFRGYDERLKFYATDTYFMKEAVKNKANVYVMESALEHDLSFFNDNIDVRDKLERFRAMEVGLKVLFCNATIFIRALLNFYLYLLRIKYCIEFKTTIFL